jgi:UDP-3-O-[3-hydroxymyristoyl] glucosamine N-acyltransferase
MRIAELAKLLEATSVEFAAGNEEVDHATAIEDGNAGAVSFIGNPQYEHFLRTTEATAVIVGEQLSIPDFGDRKPPVLLRVKRPYEAFARALEIFKPAKTLIASGVHPSAVVAESAEVDPSVNIGVNAYISDRVKIGANSNILPGAQIGADTVIGKNCVIHANAVIYDHVEIGDRCVIGPGSVIGYDGFGYVPMGDGSYRKIPQVGNVVLEDDVEIGANTTIDRGSIDDTVIGAGTKIDNLVHVAHNVRIGRLCLLMAQVGIAGSVHVEDGAILAGQAGISGHLTIGGGARIAAQAGVFGSVPAGETWSGYPARPHREALRAQAALFKLPSLIRELERLVEQRKDRER